MATFGKMWYTKWQPLGFWYTKWQPKVYQMATTTPDGAPKTLAQIFPLNLLNLLKKNTQDLKIYKIGKRRDYFFEDFFLCDF